jgi:hypothetical protein
MLLLPFGGTSERPGPSGAQPRSERSQDGIGSEHDPNLMGEATRLDSRRRATRVEGKQGEGPSRSQTILGSAEKGFASRNYQQVYADYASVVEEVISKEHVPPGYRYYIKRYFQLIKPR